MKKVIGCRVNPDYECQEDFNGYCYYCHKDMLEDKNG